MLSCRSVSARVKSVPVRSVDVVRVEAGIRTSVVDRVAVEQALEVRLHGEPFSVIMRTPGDDTDLVCGFLFSEGVIRSRDDLAEVAVGPAEPDAVDVRLSPARQHVLDDVLASRRNVTTNASCGLCGRRTLESLDVPVAAFPCTWTVAPEIILALPDVLRASQRVFSETGGLHAAGIARLDWTLESVAEDVGRHNAIDKLVGRRLQAHALPMTDRVLSVSGRVSFEIVQKALLAGMPMIVAVSAPSSLAVDLAARAGMTIVGFTRAGRFNVYTGEARVG